MFSDLYGYTRVDECSSSIPAQSRLHVVPRHTVERYIPVQKLYISYLKR